MNNPNVIIAPEWLKVEPRIFDGESGLHTSVKWWLPSYWLAVWGALTNKHYRRYNHLKGYRYITGWYTVMLQDILNSKKEAAA